MSEVGGGVTVTDADRPSPGTVGKPIPGATIRLDDDTGEVLIHAPWMMTEYFQDAEKTREIMRDGFVHSGDTGRFDAHGNLVITGRITEAFKGAKGRYVLPTGIEARFAGVPEIDQVMVTGRGLVQPVALVCLTAEASGKPRPQIEQSLRDVMAAVNPSLDTHERLGGIVVVPAFTVESGLLTPTLKLRRHAIDAVYAAKYEEWEKAGGVIFAAK
jgi:long-subunit acyl-CoA synthetase (AMP-forming)